MTCFGSPPKYLPHSEVGITIANSQNDGYHISITWNKAYPVPFNYQIGYNIYYSSDRSSVFSEYPKYLSVSDNLSLEMTDFTPGDTYYFAVRATQWATDWLQLSSMPTSGDSLTYPEGMLSADITATDTSVPLTDLDTFPNFGVIQVGAELISYSNRDLLNGTVTGLTRGFLGTSARLHQTDGYDGYDFWDPIVRIWKGLEDRNQKVIQEVSNFAYPNWAWTEADGYNYTIDQVYNQDELNYIDTNAGGFPPLDTTGYRRTDIAAMLAGECVGSYFGGEVGCVDGYGNAAGRIRGPSVNDAAAQRIEEQLNLDGKPYALLKRIRTGGRCYCYVATTQYADNRCPNCFGTGFSMGYYQFFNPRRSDGRIMVRLDPTEEDIPYQDAGLENTFSPNAYTLLFPALQDRDVLIGFLDDGITEEFRYEILSVTRNALFFGQSSAQKFRMIRIRKTDPVYKVPVFDNTSTMPGTLNTSIGMAPGLLPHTHQVVINENIISISQINQQTSLSGANPTQYHTHTVKNGIVLPTLGHTHEIFL